MKIELTFKEGTVTIVGSNPNGPKPAITLTEAQAKSLRDTLIAKYGRPA